MLIEKWELVWSLNWICVFINKDQASVLYKFPLTSVVINMIFFDIIQGAVKYTLIRLTSHII